MISSLLSRFIILVFGNLYPAYASYKAVRTKNIKEYVKWMMYWIVFAFFTCIETCTDIFLSWFPFYYEIKVIIVIWLLSPATKGSSTLYRKFVHPMLTQREQEIDEYLNQAKERGYSTVLQLGSKGVNYATNVLMQTAIKGGGNLVQTIKRSYSLSDLTEPDIHRTSDEIDQATGIQTTNNRLLRPRMHAGRSASGTRPASMHFTEVELNHRVSPSDFNLNLRSSDDVSSGYLSSEPGTGLSRTSSLTNASKTRFKGKRNEMLEMPEDMQVYVDNQQYYWNLKLLNDFIETENAQDGGYMKSNWPLSILDAVETKNDESQQSLLRLNVSSGLQCRRPMTSSDEEDEFLDTINEQSNNLGTEISEIIEANVETTQDTTEVAKSGVFVTEITDAELTPFETPTKAQLNEINNHDAPLYQRKELRSTLEEIQNNFRAKIESAPNLMTQVDKDTTRNTSRPHLFRKGKAPSPPRTIAALKSTQLEACKQNKSTVSLDQQDATELSPPACFIKETEI